MTKTFLLAVGAAAVLAACGGRSDPPPTSEVPASASASTDGFISYLQALISSDADTFAPVDTSNVTAPPADETSSPTVVD